MVGELARDAGYRVREGAFTLSTLTNAQEAFTSSAVREIVPIIYKDLDPKLLNAASLSVLAHVEHLIERGLVYCDSPLSADRALSLS